MRKYESGKYFDHKEEILKMRSEGFSLTKIALELSNKYEDDFDVQNVSRAIKAWNGVCDKFEEKLEENNFTPPENWSYGWLKTKDASVFIKNDKESVQFDWDSLINTMLKEVKPNVINVPNKENNKALHLYHSDMHIGAWVSDNSIYKNDYSLEEVERRLNKVAKLALKKKKEQGVFDTLAMFDLGDMLDGFNAQTTRGGHKLPQNMNNMEQFDSAIHLYKKHIATLVNSGIANKYVFYATTNDNHSGAFSYFALRALAEWCSFAYPQVDVRIQTKFIDVYQYGIHSFMLTHGKDIEFMKHGMPKYLDKKTELYIKDYIDRHDVSNNCHFIKGDLHQDCVDFCNKFRYRNVLSVFGASEWIFTNFGYSRAGLSYDIVSKDSKDVNEGRIFF